MIPLEYYNINLVRASFILSKLKAIIIKSITSHNITMPGDQSYTNN